MDLCSICSQLDVSSLSHYTLRVLGLYGELLLKSQSLGPGRAGCGGCAFFCALVQRSDYWCGRMPELSDHTLVMKYSRLIVSSSGHIEVRQVPRNDLRLDLCTDEEGLGDLESNPRLKRAVCPDPRERNCFDLISRWIEQCTIHDCCSPSVRVALPKRVIEIPVNPSVPPKLQITNGTLGRYVILSHCWGTTGLTTLTNALLPQFQEAISFDLLPKSFRDAIEITRRLGFRYLWIDALCIIQNDTEDWAQEAAKMASYYGLSALMISASAAKDSSEGILTPRNTLRSPKLCTENKYFLCQRPPNPEVDIRSSVLATRGWAAQERMLAPRILHYTECQMIWECAQVLESESRVRGGGRLPVGGNYEKFACQRFVTEALSQGDTISRYYDHSTDMVLGSKSEDVASHVINTWSQCVNDYAYRSLTVPTDKLHAIAGVARILNHNGELGTYLAGIWSVHLAVGLGWRKGSAKVSSPPEYTAPTWSWASVVGGVVCDSWTSPLYFDDIEKTWLETFDLKLIEQHMVWQDERNVYGAVLEGSYITVEGICFMHADLGRFLEEVCGIDCRTISRFEISIDKEDRLNMSTPYDCFLLLQSRILSWQEGYNREGRASMDILLLSWVDREASVAQRAGTAHMWLFNDEFIEQFRRIVEPANWERRTLKLV